MIEPLVYIELVSIFTLVMTWALMVLYFIKHQEDYSLTFILIYGIGVTMLNLGITITAFKSMSVC